MAHTRWTEVEARAALQALRQSGLTMTAFARHRGINTQRLYWWRKKLCDEVEFLPVEVHEPARGEPVLVMLRSGHMMKVGRDFDEVAFTRAVAVLEQC